MLRLVAMAAAELPTFGSGHLVRVGVRTALLWAQEHGPLWPLSAPAEPLCGAAKDADFAAFDNPGRVTQGESVVRAIEAVGSISGRTRTAVAIAGCGELKKGAR
jgi:hypothetical protein